jgi:hypothetical protein
MAKGRISGHFPSDAELDRRLREAMREVGDDSEVIFQAHALHHTGRMGRGIKSDVVGRNVEVTVTARDPISGYDYVGVTRFGHRKAFIEPRPDRAQASVVSTGGRRGTVRKGNAALRFVIGGRVIYRRRVRGFHPSEDWAERAMPEVNANAERVMKTLGQRIILGRL